MNRLISTLIALAAAAAAAPAAEPPRELKALAEKLGVPCHVTDLVDVKTPRTLPLVRLQDGKAVRSPDTKACVLSDGKILGVIVLCSEHDMAGLPADSVARDGNVWTGDAVEWKQVTVATAPRVCLDMAAGTYAVRALDVGGNTSEPSESVEVKGAP